MAQIITWNKDDDFWTSEKDVLQEDGETTVRQEVEETQPLRDVAIYSFPDDYNVDISENGTTVHNGDGDYVISINDVKPENSNLYNVDDYPDEIFYGYKYRYTTEGGWSDQLDTWIDPSTFGNQGD
tara:strand:+ start:393 stop:770 length:378 start_codon:yes stop_codon:yes gene_type:complete